MESPVGRQGQADIARSRTATFRKALRRARPCLVGIRAISFAFRSANSVLQTTPAILQTGPAKGPTLGTRQRMEKHRGRSGFRMALSQIRGVVRPRRLTDSGAYPFRRYMMVRTSTCRFEKRIIR